MFFRLLLPAFFVFTIGSVLGFPTEGFASESNLDDASEGLAPSHLPEKARAVEVKFRFTAPAHEVFLYQGLKGRENHQYVQLPAFGGLALAVDIKRFAEVRVGALLEDVDSFDVFARVGLYPVVAGEKKPGRGWTIQVGAALGYRFDWVTLVTLEDSSCDNWVCQPTTVESHILELAAGLDLSVRPRGRVGFLVGLEVSGGLIVDRTLSGEPQNSGVEKSPARLGIGLHVGFVI